MQRLRVSVNNRCEILCEKAVTLLTTTDKSVQEISDMHGFSSTSYFRKILYRYTNNTPRDIRKKTEKI
ncbi:MAG: helix-turn-helix domain-containing protein [Clostridia bacterium]|nr:helix-turn-helix domain-containing protein [Clostridia bacterium]